MSDLRFVSGGNRLYALLNIPERCALAGGQILVRSSYLLGTTTTATVATDYGTVWEKDITAGKGYFIPMLIAPQGGMTLYLAIDTEAIVPMRGAKSAPAEDTLPDVTPKILFSGRLMVPEEEHLDWRKVQVQPVEVTPEEVLG